MKNILRCQLGLSRENWGDVMNVGKLSWHNRCDATRAKRNKNCMELLDKSVC